jgi:hypothetical protein
MPNAAERKLKNLMGALDRTLESVATAADAARAGIRVHALAPYHDYRASLDEYEAIVLVIRNALAQQSETVAERTRQILLERERKILALSIRSALDFFFALSAFPNLSLGIRECFTQELRSLKAAERRISSEIHRGAISPDLQSDLETAREILGEIMDKAPTMLSFD